jgi:hypothetical protein
MIVPAASFVSTQGICGHESFVTTPGVVGDRGRLGDPHEASNEILPRRRLFLDIVYKHMAEAFTKIAVEVVVLH